MKPMLMGTETEYSVSGRGSAHSLPPESLYSLLHDVVRREHLCVQDAHSPQGSFVENGSRLYLDCGGHPEYSSPECTTPRQVACFDKAGELLLDAARTRIARMQPGMEIAIVKNNISTACLDAVTWGTHESYTSWATLENAAPQVIPHLVSRVFYAGAGCLIGHEDGCGFELSQRARHLVQVIGPDTTRNRALFCTRSNKNYDSASGWRRVHLIAKDSQRSSFGIYLTFATTGLLFLLLNNKRSVGKGLALADPLKAIRAISQDPWLKAKVLLADGRQLSAVEIQETFLEECELEVPRGDYPEWANEALRHWRETLELAREPLRLARKLDAYTKLFIYDHELARAGHTWNDLASSLRMLTRLRRQFPEPVIRSMLTESGKGLRAELELVCSEAAELAQIRRPGTLDRLRFAARLQALDLNYHEIGGLFDKLVQTGQLEEFISRPEMENATREPPPDGRAAARSACIREHRERGWLASWRYLCHPPSGELLDMRDPFRGGYETKTINKLPEEEAEHLSLFEHLESLLRR